VWPAAAHSTVSSHRQQCSACAWVGQRVRGVRATTTLPSQHVEWRGRSPGPVCVCGVVEICAVGVVDWACGRAAIDHKRLTSFKEGLIAHGENNPGNTLVQGQEDVRPGRVAGSELVPGAHGCNRIEDVLRRRHSCRRPEAMLPASRRHR